MYNCPLKKTGILLLRMKFTTILETLIWTLHQPVQKMNKKEYFIRFSSPHMFCAKIFCEKNARCLVRGEIQHVCALQCLEVLSLEGKQTLGLTCSEVRQTLP